jgi:hypothetical protein
MRLLRGSGCVGFALLPMYERLAINQGDDTLSPIPNKRVIKIDSPAIPELRS